MNWIIIGAISVISWIFIGYVLSLCGLLLVKFIGLKANMDLGPLEYFYVELYDDEEIIHFIVTIVLWPMPLLLNIIFWTIILPVGTCVIWLSEFRGILESWFDDNYKRNRRS